MGVGISRHVQPVDGHSLAESGRGQQSVHQPLVGVGPAVSQECVDLGKRWRQPREVEGDPADQPFLLRLRRGRKPLGLKSGQHEAVDGISGPGRMLHVRKLYRPGRDERPVVLPPFDYIEDRLTAGTLGSAQPRSPGTRSKSITRREVPPFGPQQAGRQPFPAEPDDRHGTNEGQRRNACPLSISRQAVYQVLVTGVGSPTLMKNLANDCDRCSR